MQPLLAIVGDFLFAQDKSRKGECHEIHLKKQSSETVQRNHRGTGNPRFLHRENLVERKSPFSKNENGTIYQEKLF